MTVIFVCFLSCNKTVNLVKKKKSDIYQHQFCHTTVLVILQVSEIEKGLKIRFQAER